MKPSVFAKASHVDESRDLHGRWSGSLGSNPFFSLGDRSWSSPRNREAVRQFLVVSFPGLVGMEQHSPHFDPERGRTTDPIEHTLEVLDHLVTGGLSESDAKLLRLAMVFHDVGKEGDAFSSHHPEKSAIALAARLSAFKLSPSEGRDLLFLVRNHDLFARVLRKRMSPEEFAQAAKSPRMAAMLIKAWRADVSAIRGVLGNNQTGAEMGRSDNPDVVAAEHKVMAAFSA